MDIMSSAPALPPHRSTALPAFKPCTNILGCQAPAHCHPSRPAAGYLEVPGKQPVLSQTKFPSRLRHRTFLPSSVITAAFIFYVVMRERKYFLLVTITPIPGDVRWKYRQKHSRCSINLLLRYWASVLGRNFLETLKNHDNWPPPNSSLSHLCHEPYRPFIQSGLGKQCRDAFVYHQELLPFYHVIHDFLCIKRINCLAISLTTFARNPS